MTTSGDMIQDALEGIGVYAPGETITAADSARALKVLNDMIDSWSNEDLTCFAILEQSIVLVSGTYQYTCGVGGNLAVRPLRVIDGYGAAYILDNTGNRYPVDVIHQDKWNLIGNILTTNSNVPDKLFYDPQFPLGIINVFPIPNIAWTLFFDSYLQLVGFPDIFTSVSLPPGYVKAMQDSLKLELIPYFKPDNFQVPPLWIEIASKSKGNVKRMNIKEMIANYDPEIVSHSTYTYNIYRDNTG